MIEVFVIELMNLLKDKCSHREEPKVKEEKKYKKPHEEFLEQIEEEIDRLDGLKKHVCFHQDNLRMLHKVISDVLRKMTEDEPVFQRESEKSKPETSESPEVQSKDTEEDQLRMDGQPLAQLEQGLSNAITVLSGTRMASYFKAIKQLVEDLKTVANADEMPEDQRAASIEDALQEAVNVLSKSACAARSKVTIDLRENLIELLDKVKG